MNDNKNLEEYYKYKSNMTFLNATHNSLAALENAYYTEKEQQQEEAKNKPIKKVDKYIIYITLILSSLLYWVNG
jgi:hypothetical protein